MPDITMCSNDQCILKNQCYRAQASPNHYQSWAIFSNNNGTCKHHIPIKPIKEPSRSKTKLTHHA